MKRNIYICISLFYLLLPVFGQDNGNISTLSSIVLEEKNDTLFLEMDIRIPPEAPGTRQMLRIIPRLIAAGGTEQFLFPTVGTEGKKREQLNRRKRKFNKTTGETHPQYTYRLTDTLYTYRFTSPYRLWMDDALLNVEEIINGCAGSQQVYTFIGLPAIQVQSLIPYVPVPVVSWYEPEQQVKERSIEKTAYVDFQVGKSVIVPSFKRNPEELPKILETIREVGSDDDITITRIELTGFASPEGSYALNEKLSEQRTLVLKNYIRRHAGLPENLFRTRWVPEDWQGFEERVINSELKEKEEILSIIASGKEPDQKEQDLKKMGSVYRTILNDIFPDLRRTIYHIGYTVRDYSVEEVEVLINKQPENLSPFEFYQIAKQSGRGSARWNEVILQTALYNPADPVSNINAAAVLLSEGKYEESWPYLVRAGNDPRVHINMAAYYLLKGDPDKAEEHLRKAPADEKEIIEKNTSEMQQLRHSLNRIAGKSN